MAISKFIDQRSIISVTTRQQLNLRAGLEVDEEATTGLVDIIDGLVPDMYFSDYQDQMAINSLQRYTLNRDARTFSEVDSMRERHEWDQKGYIEGIILADIPHRAMRQNVVYDPDGDNPIMCISGTGETGTFNPEYEFPNGNPTGDCRTCQYSKWPTDAEKAQGIRAPRCPDRLRLFVKTNDMMKPAVLDLPGSYKRSWEAYTKKLGRNMLRPWEVVTVMSIGINAKGNTFLNCEEAGLIDSTQEEVVQVVNAMRQLAYLLVDDAQNFHVRNVPDSGYNPDGTWYEKPGATRTVEGQAQVIDVEPEADPVPERPGDATVEPPWEHETPKDEDPKPEPELESVPAGAPQMSPVEAAKERLRQRNQAKS